MHFGMTLSNRRTADEIFDEINDGFKLGLAVKVDTFEDDAVVFRRWLQSELDFFSGMQWIYP